MSTTGVIRTARELGQTRLLTRREKTLTWLRGILTLAGAAAAMLFGFRVLGGAPVLHWPEQWITGKGGVINPNSTQQFHTPWVEWPVTQWWWAALIGLVPFALWVRFVVQRFVGKLTGNARHRGLARPEKIRKVYGPHAVRKAARFTRPDTTRPERFLLGTSAFGMNIGKAITPKGGGDLWVNLEQRVRIVARPGWGKTLRLLVPIIRQLQGPAMISTTEPELFTATVKARQTRRPPSRFGWLYQPDPRTYPVAVVDCSNPVDRITGDWPSVQWNPIPGCEDFTTATRRAQALVKGTDSDDGDSTSRWFEDGASKIIAAWLHAAALSTDIELVDLAKWLGASDYTVPEGILRDHATDQAALMGMLKYLDPKGGRTTSNIETSVSKALYSLTSVEGAAVCGSRFDPGQYDMAALIQAKGTMYLLGEPDRMTVIRPLLSLIASEMFVAAERIARDSRGAQPAFYAVLDELRSGVRVATLPDIASEKRKWKLHYIYAVTNGGDEEALYGEADAARLKAAAGTSIYGGLDELSAEDITGRAGQAGVVTASRGGMMGGSESTHDYDVLTTSDMQQLADGESVIVGKGILPFLAFTPATHEVRALRRRITREQAQLRTEVTV